MNAIVVNCPHIESFVHTFNIFQWRQYSRIIESKGMKKLPVVKMLFKKIDRFKCNVCSTQDYHPSPRETRTPQPFTPWPFSPNHANESTCHLLCAGLDFGLSCYTVKASRARLSLICLLIHNTYCCVIYIVDSQYGFCQKEKHCDMQSQVPLCCSLTNVTSLFTLYAFLIQKPLVRSPILCASPTSFSPTI